MPTYLSDIDLSYPYNINAPTIDLGRLPIAYIEAAVERQLTYEKISLSVSATMVIFDYPPIDITALNTHPIQQASADHVNGPYNGNGFQAVNRTNPANELQPVVQAASHTGRPRRKRGSHYTEFVHLITDEMSSEMYGKPYDPFWMTKYGIEEPAELTSGNNTPNFSVLRSRQFFTPGDELHLEVNGHKYVCNVEAPTGSGVAVRLPVFKRRQTKGTLLNSTGPTDIFAAICKETGQQNRTSMIKAWKLVTLHRAGVPCGTLFEARWRYQLWSAAMRGYIARLGLDWVNEILSPAKNDGLIFTMSDG